MNTFVRQFRVKTSVAPRTGERWALIVGPDGIAHEHSTLYGVMCLREGSLSFNSQLAHLQAIAG